MLQDLPAPRLLMGLSSVEGSDGQSLHYILVHLTLLNRLFSKDCECAHDLTWPQLCLMICVNGNPNLLLKQNSIATWEFRLKTTSQFCLGIYFTFVSELFYLYCERMEIQKWEMEQKSKTGVQLETLVLLLSSCIMSVVATELSWVLKWLIIARTSGLGHPSSTCPLLRQCQMFPWQLEDNDVINPMKTFMIILWFLFASFNADIAIKVQK